MTYEIVVALATLLSSNSIPPKKIMYNLFDITQCSMTYEKRFSLQGLLSVILLFLLFEIHVLFS